MKEQPDSWMQVLADVDAIRDRCLALMRSTEGERLRRLDSICRSSPDADWDHRGYFVYCLWSGDGELLYVGKSANVLARLGSHVGDTRKNRHVHRITLVRCASRPDMDEAERDLIRRNQPPWNVVHTMRSTAGRSGPKGERPQPTTPGEAFRAWVADRGGAA